MYGVVYQNGYCGALFRLMRDGPYVLPGSTKSILTFYYGVPPIDKLLTLASVMFANVTDGSCPQLSLYAVHLASQFLRVLLLIIIEGLREGNRSGAFRFASPWSCMMQDTGYGFAMPLYGMIHLLKSATSERHGSSLVNAILPQRPAELEVLSVAVALGYVLPAIPISIPHAPNYIHQWLRALWQSSPFWIVVWQKFLAARLTRQRRATEEAEAESQSGDKSPEDQGNLVHDTSSGLYEWTILSGVYRFAFPSCLISHAGSLLVIAAASLRPSIFPSGLSEALTFSNVFILPSPFKVEEMASMATGIHNFFQYHQYAGSAAAIVWSGSLWINSEKEALNKTDWVMLVLRISFLSMVSGPAGAAVWLVWSRDENLVSKDYKRKAKDQ